MANKIVAFHVEFELPEGADVEDAKRYTHYAVINMCGGLQPSDGEGDGDPMFDLDSNTVEVFTVKRWGAYRKKERRQ